MTTVDHMDVSILCSIPHGLNLKKSLKIWHNGWKLSATIADGIRTKQAQFLHHLRCFSKRELSNSWDKVKTGETWSFVLYNLTDKPSARHLFLTFFASRNMLSILEYA